MDAARRERRHHRKAAAAAAGGGGVVGAGTGGGGAAAAAARAAYGDVFGGPPRFAAPFGGAPLDYAEVFGGVATTCTIPYLDLPPAAAVGADGGGFFACRGKGDYGEIFGRFDFADFALPYEDLFGGPGPEPEEREPEITSPSSWSSRSSTKKESSLHEDEPPIVPQHYQNMDHHHHFKDHKFSPISFSPDTESQQFVMSYNKTTERKPDDLIEMTTCTTEPSMDFVIDSRNLSHGPATNHVSRIVNGTIASDDNGRNPISASVSVRSPENDFVADQNQQSPSWTPISGSVSANENHKNSDNLSTCSIVTPDYAFLQVSDIDAQAELIKAQPLLRQQSKLLNKKESAAKGSINLVNHSHTPTSVAHTTSSSNVPHADKKADANPTSASAAAAMKEAMDFAEARLKAAKELLERKGDSFKLRKKSSHHRSSRSTEIKAPVCVEEDTSKQKLSVKKSSEEEKDPDADGLLSDNITKLSTVRFDHSNDNGKRELPLEKPQQMMPHCTDSCQTSSKLEKLGKWKSGSDFFELTGDDQKCKTDETIREDDKHEQMDHITSVINDHSETVLSTADSDLERYEKLWEVNDGRNLGLKHVDLREGKTAPVDKDRVSVILEASTENMARQKTHNAVGKESHDTDECLELPSMSDASAKLDVIKDMPDSSPEACSSGSTSDLRDVGDSIPKVSPVGGASQDSKLELEVPCSGGMQCTSGSNEKLQEPSDASNIAISQGSNIKSLILEELQESDVYDAFLRPRPSRIDQEAETYGREKFSFIDGSLLHKGAKINEVISEEVERVEIEEKVSPCTHPEETVVDLDAECPEDENDVILQNDNLADQEESNMLNVFEVASKLIKRELDQEMHGSLGHEVDHMKEKMDGLISDVNDKEADETPLENSDRAGSEEGSAPCNQDDQKSPESTNREQSNVDARFDTTSNEVGSESFSGDEGVIKAASDSSSRATINLKDDPASSSEMYTHMQHSMRKDDSPMSQTSCSAPGLGEIGEVSNRRERKLPTERSTPEEKSRASKMEEKDATARISKADHRPSSLETTRGPTKSAEAPTPVSADTWKKEAFGVQRAKQREDTTRADNATDKDKSSSRKAQEAKESERRLEKERELAEEKERRKLEEERERERKKDRLAVERATREAHERAFAEAREKAEKMALERITAARQRASAEAREKEERASAEAAAERATREARIKAERAAVERATAEARERAIEKAKAEKALAEARERRERYRSSLKEGFKSNQDIRQESQFQRATSSNFTRNPDSGNRVVEVESALRHKARLERHQRTTERVTKALAEKNMRDMQAQREQAEKHRLSEFLDPEIKRWSNGKEGNLRALLSTLQYILGADSGWQPVPLTDLITAVAVKKAYRKATLCVHPDKLQQRGATIRQKYICEKVFDLLKDAWNKFTSEER